MARRISVKKLAYAVRNVEEATGNVTYGKPVTIKKFIKIKTTDESSSYTFYSDGGVEESSTRLSKVTGELELGYLPAELRKMLFGNAYDEVTGLLVRGASDVPANVALLYSMEKSDGNEDFRVLYNCSLSMKETESSTREDSIEGQTFALEFTAIPEADGSVDAEACTDGGKMSAETWFGTVQVKK